MGLKFSQPLSRRPLPPPPVARQEGCLFHQTGARTGLHLHPVPIHAPEEWQGVCNLRDAAGTGGAALAPSQSEGRPESHSGSKCGRQDGHGHLGGGPLSAAGPQSTGTHCHDRQQCWAVPPWPTVFLPRALWLMASYASSDRSSDSSPGKFTIVFAMGSGYETGPRCT